MKNNEEVINVRLMIGKWEKHRERNTRLTQT